MKKIDIIVPEGLHYLGEQPGFFKQFDGKGNCIVDKVITGCGATTDALDDDVHTILVGARKALLNCKAESNRFRGKVYMFKTEEDIAKKLDVPTLKKRLQEYVSSATGTMKILVTYDSFKYVAEQLMHDGTFHRFRIVVDEAQTLFGDAAFKAKVELEFLNWVLRSNHVIFLSATPYIESYLDMLGYFQNLPYYHLVWPKSSLQPTNIHHVPYTKTVINTVKGIIGRFRRDSFFESKLLNGNLYLATEAVFFLNNLSDIIKIIQKNGLTPDDTNVICGDQPENASDLAGIKDNSGKRLGFKVGKAPKDGEPHKTFTFVTKAAFEGTDFYSTCAYTYIFSDVSINSMAYDISLDLRQILGRQRREDNVFRYDATFYYRQDPTLRSMSFPEFNNYIQGKLAVSDAWIQDYESKAQFPLLQENFMSDKIQAQKSFNFAKDYVTFIENPHTHKATPVRNDLAWCNELRAWEIQQTQYVNTYQVLRAIGQATIPDNDYPLADDFVQMLTGDFKTSMRNYCDILSAHPEYKGKLESLPQIPLSIKQYYNTISSEDLKKCKYEEGRIKRYLNMDTTEDQIREAVRGWFVSGKRYTLSEVKEALQGYYDYYGKIDSKASASDLKDYLPGEFEEITLTVDGKRHKGYRIL